MIEADRILEPVSPDSPPLRGLREYDSSSALADALRATSDAIEQSLRLLLRADRGAAESDRMRAMSRQELPFAELLDRLRARDRVSIELGGMIHQLRRAIDSGGVAWSPAPADADRALEAVARLRKEVRSFDDATVREAAHHTVAAHPIDVEATSEVPPARGRRSRLVPLLVAAAIAIALLWLLISTRVFGLFGPDPMEQGIAAFQADDLTEASRHFREAVQEDETDPLPRLYLGRVYRRLGRHAEAGDQLERAVRLAPRDGDVRRELGYLFIDLRSYAASVRQFEQAVELEPAEEASWIGLVRAMRLGNDPRAEATLARAPAAAQALLAREPAATGSPQSME